MRRPALCGMSPNPADWVLTDLRSIDPGRVRRFTV